MRELGIDKVVAIDVPGWRTVLGEGVPGALPIVAEGAGAAIIARIAVPPLGIIAPAGDCPRRCGRAVRPADKFQFLGLTRPARAQRQLQRIGEAEGAAAED